MYLGFSPCAIFPNKNARNSPQSWSDLKKTHGSRLKPSRLVAAGPLFRTPVPSEIGLRSARRFGDGSLEWDQHSDHTDLWGLDSDLLWLLWWFYGDFMLKLTMIYSDSIGRNGVSMRIYLWWFDGDLMWFILILLCSLYGASWLYLCLVYWGWWGN